MTACAVCPFDAEPLFDLAGGEYRRCDPRNLRDCPVSYVCDRSYLLGRHVCCRQFSAGVETSSNNVQRVNFNPQQPQQLFPNEVSNIERPVIVRATPSEPVFVVSFVRKQAKGNCSQHRHNSSSSSGSTSNSRRPPSARPTRRRPTAPVATR